MAGLPEDAMCGDVLDDEFPLGLARRIGNLPAVESNPDGLSALAYPLDFQAVDVTGVVTRPQQLRFLRAIAHEIVQQVHR